MKKRIQRKGKKKWRKNKIKICEAEKRKEKKYNKKVEEK